MDLTAIAATNFRAFKEAGIRPPATGLLLVAGAINSGKSALLSAFDVVAANVDDTGSWRHTTSSSPAQVIALFTVSDQERRRILHGAANADQLFEQGAFAQLEYRFEDHGDEPPELTRVRGRWPGQEEFLSVA